VSAGDDYIRRVWEKDGSNLCFNCERPIIYDRDSGYWLHADFGKVDGQNGLFCSPIMWDDEASRIYAKPARRWAAWGAGL
jgi:hypothetical protein